MLVRRIRRDPKKYGELGIPRSPDGQRSASKSDSGSADEISEPPTTPVIVSTPTTTTSNSTATPEPPEVRVPEKFFIFKNLTVQDLKESA